MTSDRPTLKAIADASGVSAQTVSRVLNTGQAHLCRPEIRARVVSVATRLGYRPNVSAQAVRSGRFGSVGLLVSTRPGFSHLPEALVRGLQSALEEHDTHAVLAMLPAGGSDAAPRPPAVLRKRLLDGLLVNLTHAVPPAVVALIETLALPTLWMNQRRERDCVAYDDRAAATALVDHLLALGHRRIAYVDYAIDRSDRSPWHYSVREREDGYRAAMQAAGLAPQVQRPAHPLPASERVAHSLGWLRRSRPSAVLAYDLDHSLRPVLYAAEHLGIAVPRELSLATFDTEPRVERDLELTLAQLDQTVLAQRAVEPLMARIERRRISRRACLLPVPIIAGTSCVPAASS